MLRSFILFLLFVLVGIPVITSTLIWLEDRYRNGALYAFCDELPINNAYAPLKRQIFTAGCYIKSACHPGEYNVSMELSAYEVTSLYHCNKPRVLRPDRALASWIKEKTEDPARFRYPVHKAPESLEVAEKG